MSPVQRPGHQGVRALGRRVLLFILNPRPPWWGYALAWGVLAALLLVLFPFPGLVARSHSAAFHLVWSERSPNEWHVNDPRPTDPVIIQFRGLVALERGPGWERWSATTFERLVQTGGGPGPPRAQIDQLRRDGWQGVIDTLQHGSPPPGRIPTNAELGGVEPVAALELLRDGQATRTIRRPAFWARTAIAAMLTALLALACLTGALRLLMLIGYSQRLERAARGLCPSCGYPLGGLPSHDTCPECGLNIPADADEARLELGRPRRVEEPLRHRGCVPLRAPLHRPRPHSGQGDPSGNDATS